MPFPINTFVQVYFLGWCRAQACASISFPGAHCNDHRPARVWSGPTGFYPYAIRLWICRRKSGCLPLRTSRSEAKRKLEGLSLGPQGSEILMLKLTEIAELLLCKALRQAQAKDTAQDCGVLIAHFADRREQPPASPRARQNRRSRRQGEISVSLRGHLSGLDQVDSQ